MLVAVVRRCAPARTTAATAITANNQDGGSGTAKLPACSKLSGDMACGATSLGCEPSGAKMSDDIAPAMIDDGFSNAVMGDPVGRSSGLPAVSLAAIVTVALEPITSDD
jgi:hypothetical protein